MMSWLLPPNNSASVTLPAGPSNTYSFSIFTQGSLRRSRFKASRSFENFFSFPRSFLRAASHSVCETTLRFSRPRTVLISGITWGGSGLRLEGGRGLGHRFHGRQAFLKVASDHGVTIHNQAHEFA